MSEWQGPYQCVKCGVVYMAGCFRTEAHLSQSGIWCDGEMRPIERRRAPQPDAPAGVPWPLQDILRRLCRAGQHLLTDHDCDAHGYEEVRVAIRAGYKWLRALAAPRPERTYSAAEVREAFRAGRRSIGYWTEEQCEKEILRNWPGGERKDGEAGG